MNIKSGESGTMSATLALVKACQNSTEFQRAVDATHLASWSKELGRNKSIPMVATRDKSVDMLDYWGPKLDHPAMDVIIDKDEEFSAVEHGEIEAWPTAIMKIERMPSNMIWRILTDKYEVSVVRSVLMWGLFMANPTWNVRSDVRFMINWRTSFLIIKVKVKTIIALLQI